MLPDPFWDNVVCSICQIGMTRWGYTVAKSGDNSLSPWSICPSSRVKFKPEQGRTCSQLSSTSTTQWSQCTFKQWEDREQLATHASSEGQGHQMVSCWSSLQLNNRLRQRHPLQLCCHPTPRLSGSQVGLLWSKSHILLTETQQKEHLDTHLTVYLEGDTSQSL